MSSSGGRGSGSIGVQKRKFRKQHSDPVTGDPEGHSIEIFGIKGRNGLTIVTFHTCAFRIAISISGAILSSGAHLYPASRKISTP